MERINITYIDDELKDAIWVGEGSVATCYKAENDRVYKLFKNIKIAKEMTKKTLFNGDADSFCSLTNDSVHTPDRLVVDDSGIILGYSYHYVEGTAIAHISEDITVLELFKNYKKLIDDIQKISFDGFRITDMNRENILFDSNNYFHIIDLDNGCFMQNASKANQIYFNKSNCSIVFKTIINNIFGKDVTDELRFDDYLLNELLMQIYCGDIKIMRSLIDYISSSLCEETNPKIAALRKYAKLKTKSKKNVF